LLRVELDRVRETIPEELREERARVARVEDEIETVLDEVRELSRGLHPAQLSRGGLRAALRALAQTSPIAVDLSVETDERPPEPVETGAYYVVSEALTNAAKYSHATAIAVSVATRGSTLYATIEDDGIGGAEAGPGSGLTGLRDRVEALGGRFSLDSPAGVGTRIAIELPL
jgi:signal transduction histidine kinase